MRQRKQSLLFSAILGFSMAGAAQAIAQTGRAWQAVLPQDRVTEAVDEAERVTLRGNTLPQAIPVREAGSVNGGRRLDRIVLVLKPDATQQAALDALVQQQQDPKSPLYHAWLTPESYAEHFGVSNADIEQVESWLDRNGFQLDEVPASRRAVIFSGTAAQVEAAFQTTLRTYWIGGETHIANAADPSVPAALATVIEGVASLHDVFSAPQHRSAPAFTTGGAHYLSPADFATIYDANSLYNQAYDGSGETIAIAGRADISLPDVRSFRSKFGLPAKDPVVVLAGADPGSSSGGDVDESMLDVEWSGAVAKKATINFVTSASTATSDGVFLSAQYIVNHNLAPVMSVSYGLCEAALGASGNSFLNALWQQAAAQGIAVLVSAGDSGAAGCDASGATKAAQGRGVNGICSTPYSTCVGGTEFNDTANPGQYWSSSNSGSGNSALGYIPENAWNESGSSGLWSTGGGVSTVYAKPAWQTGVGVPADGKRDVPDVALTAAGHDAYLVEMSGGLYAFSGTSASSPSFAGLLALVEQKEAARLGNANPQLYKLATAQRAGGTAAFHDVTAGNNSVPGVTGFTAGAGYDQTTGLGSVDAENLVTAWGGTGPPAPTPALTLTAPTASFTLAKGGTATVTVTTAVSGGFSSPVSFSVSGLPSGLTATFSPAAIAAPGAGSATLKLTAGAALVPGAWTLTITATGGGLSKTASLSGSMAGLGVTATPAAAALARGGTLAITVKTTGVDGFNAAVALTVSGLPAGVTGKFAPTSVAAPGSGTSVLTLTAAKTATLGAAKIQVTASGGGLSATGAATFSVAATAASGRGAPIQPDPIPPRRPLLEQVAE